GFAPDARVGPKRDGGASVRPRRTAHEQPPPCREPPSRRVVSVAACTCQVDPDRRPCRGSIDREGGPLAPLDRGRPDATAPIPGRSRYQSERQRTRTMNLQPDMPMLINRSDGG